MSTQRHEESHFLKLPIGRGAEAGGFYGRNLNRTVKISSKGEQSISSRRPTAPLEQAIVTDGTRFPEAAIVAEEGGGSERDCTFRWHRGHSRRHTISRMDTALRFDRARSGGQIAASVILPAVERGGGNLHCS